MRYKSAFEFKTLQNWHVTVDEVIRCQHIVQVKLCRT